MVSSFPCFGPRFVGDPVDVVTGEVRDLTVDFQIAGRRPFEWWREYQSFRAAKENRGIGAGHRHVLDWWLRVGFDGVNLETHRDPVRFRHLWNDGEDARASGWRLLRVNPLVYQLSRPGEPLREFSRIDPARKHLRLTRMMHADGGQTILQYRGAHGFELQGVHDSQGWSLRFEWHGGLLRAVRARGAFGEFTPIQYGYDEAGHLVEGLDAYKHRFTWAYDEHGSVVRRADRRGYAFVYQYDRQGRCAQVGGEDGVNAVAFDYGSCESKVTHLANGATFFYRYRPDGNLEEIEGPYGAKRKFVVDAEGTTSAQVDARGDLWPVVRSPDGIALGLRDPLGYLHPTHENPNDPELDPLLHDVPYTVLEQEFGKLQPLGFEVPRTPELRAVLPAEIASGMIPGEYAGVEREVRDASGLLHRRERHYADGRVDTRRYVYDPNGNLRKLRDFDRSEWVHEYQSWNHRVLTRDPLGGLTHVVYGPRDKVVVVQDPGGTLTEYAWDLRDRLVEVRRHGKVRERYVLDGAGWLVEKRGAEGELLVRYERGPLGTLLARRSEGVEESFERDDRGRVVRATRTTPTGSNTIECAYDLPGRRVADTRDGAGVWHTFTLGHEGRITVRPTPPSEDDEPSPAFEVRYRYPEEGVVEITDSTGRVHRVARRLSGLIERRFANGTVETSQYDGKGRCLARASEGASGRWRRRFGYSSEGHLLIREDDRRGNLRYHYDAAHRLVSVEHANGRVDPYEHDLAGNLLHKPGLAEALIETGPPGLLSQTRVAMASGNRLYRANGDRFHYDERDHVVRREGYARTLEYRRDALGRLVEITLALQGQEPRCIWQAEYDVFGRRVCKRWEASDGWQEQRFFWDTDRLAAEVLPDGRMRVYVYAHLEALVPMLAVEYASVGADPQSGRVFVLQADHRGAVERVEDEQGRVVWDATVGPHGEVEVRRGEGEHQPFRLVGQYFDKETGLSAQRYRYWAAELGRFLESDPVGLAGGINVYVWPGNPLRDADPLGLGCPDKEEGDDGGAAKTRDGETEQEGAGLPRRAPHEDVPLDQMSQGQLWDVCSFHAERLASVQEPRGGKHVYKNTFSVGVVEGVDGRRRLVATSNIDRGPGGRAQRYMEDHGIESRDPPPRLERRPEYSDDGEHTGNSTYETARTGSAGEPLPDRRYDKREESRHHAEQRMEEGRSSDERLVAQSPSQECCPGCHRALSEPRTDPDGAEYRPLDRVAPELRGPREQRGPRQRRPLPTGGSSS